MMMKMHGIRKVGLHGFSAGPSAVSMELWVHQRRAWMRIEKMIWEEDGGGGTWTTWMAAHLLRVWRTWAKSQIPTECPNEAYEGCTSCWELTTDSRMDLPPRVW
jgi:hypothetical protein